MRRLILLVSFVAALVGVQASAATLVPPAERTASGTGSVSLSHSYVIEAAVFQLSVTAAATDSDDTLDVFIQHTVDGGTTWDDFVHFTQATGDGGAVTYLASWQSNATPESELKAPADAAMAAGVLQGPAAGEWRVKWVVVDSNGAGGAGDEDVAFTFAVYVQTLRSGR